MGIKFTPEGDRVRVAKLSGAVIPKPDTLAKVRRAKRPAEPGPRDTPADLVAKVTYAPPAALLPYLASSGPQSLFRARGGKGADAEPALPSKLRHVRMRAHHRKALRGRWEQEQAEARLLADTKAALRALAVKRRAAGAAGPTGGGGSGEQHAELR